MSEKPKKYMTDEEKWAALPKRAKIFRIAVIVITLIVLGVSLLVAAVSGNSSSTCIGTTKEGKSCHNKPSKGSMYCYQHK